MSIGSHQSSRALTTTWLTPPHVIAALGGSTSFDLDPCAFSGSQFPTAKHGYSLPDTDGLRADWFGRVWLNPPYTAAQIGHWLERMAKHGRGTALIFARTETRAFQAHVFERAHGLLFVAGRINFLRPDGSEAGNAGAPSVLCAYGQDDLDRMAASPLRGTLVPLRFARYVAVAMSDAMGSTWRDLVIDYVRKSGSATVALSDLYRHLARSPKTNGRRHWRAKVRQIVQMTGRRVGPARWQLELFA